MSKLEDELLGIFEEALASLPPEEQDVRLKAFSALASSLSETQSA